MLTILNNLKPVCAQRVKRWAKLWQITRKDGEVLRFTDHSSSIVFKGQVYSPSDGMDATAVQREGGVKSQNFEATGIISSDRITEDDLHAGKYFDAVIIEYTVDWQYPFDAINTRKFIIQAMRFSNERWEAGVESLVAHLAKDVGKIVTRACPYNLGDSKCGVSIGGYTHTGTVLGIPTDANNRLTFTSSDSDILLQDEGYFTDGEVEFTSGDNDGVRAEIQEHTKSGGVVTISLNLEVPFAIVAGVGIILRAGCNKLSGAKDTTGHCKNKFDNLPNYGGDAYSPTEDQIIYPE